MNTEQLVKRVEQQLRIASRKIVELPHVSDAFQFIADSCFEQLPMDFVGVFLSKNGQYELTAWSGEAHDVQNVFPVRVSECSMKFIDTIVTHLDDLRCPCFQKIEEASIKTWFTVPLKVDAEHFGFCLIGYLREMDLIPDMGIVFNEFGKDVEVSMRYHRQKNDTEQLEQLLAFQQHLLAETLMNDDFDGITKKISDVMEQSVLVLDRFYQPISEVILPSDTKKHANFLQNRKQYTLWDIRVGLDVFGYLAFLEERPIDNYMKLTIEVARNIYAIQFMKQKISFDAHEKSKEQFLDCLLKDPIDHTQLQARANLLDIDLQTFQKLALMTYSAPKQKVLEKLKPYEQELLIIQYQDLLCVLAKQSFSFDHFLTYAETIGIKKIVVSPPIDKLSDYRKQFSYMKAALPSLQERLTYYETFGVEPLLQQIQDAHMKKLFLEHHIEPLLDGKNNLLETLEMYLMCNGNATETANALYIHRSTLLYRLEKIESLLNVDLHLAETRFALFFAIKLYQLKGL